MDAMRQSRESAVEEGDEKAKEEEETEWKRGPTIHEAAKSGDIDRLKKLIEHKPLLKE